MPTVTNAQLRHALHYLKELDSVNDQYKSGGPHIELTLVRFDLIWPNVLTAFDTVAGLSQPYLARRKQADNIQVRTAMELCNVFPDAGAYLINLRFGALEREKWIGIALQASQSLRNDLTTQAHLGNLGLAALEEGEPEKAIRYFRRALRIARSIDNRVHEAAWLGNLGNAFAAMSEFRRAVYYHRKHLSISHEIGDQLGESHALGNLGVSYAFLGRLEKAEDYYEQHLKLSKELGDKRSEAHALLNLGFTSYDLHNIDRAEARFRASARIAAEIKDDSMWQLAQSGIADVLIDQDKHADAIPLLEEAISSARKRCDQLVLLNLLGSLGNAFNKQGNLEAAVLRYGEQLQLAKNTGNRAHQCNALCNLSSIYLKMGENERALAVAQAGMMLARELQTQHSESFLSWQIGLLYEQKGRIKEAVDCFQFTIAYEQKHQDPDANLHAAKLNALREQLKRKTAKYIQSQK